MAFLRACLLVLVVPTLIFADLWVLILELGGLRRLWNTRLAFFVSTLLIAWLVNAWLPQTWPIVSPWDDLTIKFEFEVRFRLINLMWNAIALSCCQGW